MSMKKSITYSVKGTATEKPGDVKTVSLKAANKNKSRSSSRRRKMQKTLRRQLSILGAKSQKSSPNMAGTESLGEEIAGSDGSAPMAHVVHPESKSSMDRNANKTNTTTTKSSSKKVKKKTRSRKSLKKFLKKDDTEMENAELKSNREAIRALPTQPPRDVSPNMYYRHIMDPRSHEIVRGLDYRTVQREFIKRKKRRMQISGYIFNVSLTVFFLCLFVSIIGWLVVLRVRLYDRTFATIVSNDVINAVSNMNVTINGIGNYNLREWAAWSACKKKSKIRYRELSPHIVYYTWGLPSVQESTSC